MLAVGRVGLGPSTLSASTLLVSSAEEPEVLEQGFGVGWGCTGVVLANQPEPQTVFSPLGN